jgi:hypothetical protein
VHMLHPRSDMLQVSNANVSKLDPISMLQTLIFVLQMLSHDVADTCCWVLQTLIFNVADVEFRCCRHVMFAFVSRRRGGVLDVGCCTQYGSQHGHNIVATWSQHGVKDSRCWMLHITAFATFSQHVRNIYSMDFRSNG